MNYYKHHIGDYLKDTGGLTLLQHGVYLLLLMNFYATESPLPADEVYSIARAFSKAERDAVDKVLSKYWVLSVGGYTNRRAMEEIAADRSFIEKQRANGQASAVKRWGKPKGNGGYNDPMGLVTTKTQPPTPTPIPNTESEGLSPQPNGKHRPKTAKRCPPDFVPDFTFANSEIPDLDAEREAAKFRDWEFKTPRSDWPACWRTWVRNAKERGNYAKKIKTGEVTWSRTL